MKKANILDPTKSIVDLGSEEYYGTNGHYRSHPGPYLIPDLQKLNNIFPGVMDGKNPNPIERMPIVGEISRRERELLARFANWKQPDYVLEFGTFLGSDTRVMAEYTNKKVITVDLPLSKRNEKKSPHFGDTVYFLGEELGKEYRGSTVEHKITQIFADINTPECYKKVNEILGENKFDLVLIDPAHDAMTTLNAWDIAKKCLADDAIVIFHDYTRLVEHVGVARVVLELAVNEGYIFYHPYIDTLPDGSTGDEMDYTMVFHINSPEAKRDWGMRDEVNKVMRNRHWHNSEPETQSTQEERHFKNRRMEFWP